MHSVTKKKPRNSSLILLMLLLVRSGEQLTHFINEMKIEFSPYSIPTSDLPSSSTLTSKTLSCSFATWTCNETTSAYDIFWMSPSSHPKSQLSLSNNWNSIMYKAEVSLWKGTLICWAHLLSPKLIGTIPQRLQRKTDTSLMAEFWSLWHIAEIQHVKRSSNCNSCRWMLGNRDRTVSRLPKNKGVF